MYSGSGTKNYQPYTMKAETLDAGEVWVRCYNLDPIAGAELNREYLSKLIFVARKVNLPVEYIQELEILN